MTPYICDLHNADEIQLVSGKGANLRRLLRLGFPVLLGFVLATVVFRAAPVANDVGAPTPRS